MITKSEFLIINPKIRDDVRRKDLLILERIVDWEKFAAEIEGSAVLKGKISLTWLLRFYERIVRGDFRDFPIYRKKPELLKRHLEKSRFRSPGATENDRRYSEEDFNSLISDPETVKF